MSKCCNCIYELETKLQQKLGYDNKPRIPFEIFSGRTYTIATVTVPDPRRKIGIKNKEINILHSYCPFCGKPYPKDDDAEGAEKDG